MSLRASEAEPLAAWWLDATTGAALQGVRQPNPQTLILSLRAPGRTLHLLLAVGRRRARFSGIDKPPANPAQPHAFQGYLRAHLGGRVERFELVGGDRVLRIDFRSPDGIVSLIHEFTDATGNVFFVQDGSIRSALGPLRPGLKLGGPWTPPAGAPRVQPDRFSAFEGEARDRAVAATYAQVDLDEEESSLRVAVRRPLAAARKKLARQRSQQEAEVARAGESARLRREGELLQASFHLLSRGQESIQVTDWYAEGQPTLEVALDPKLAPAEQIESRFRRARRADRGAEEANRRLKETRAREQVVAALLAEFEGADVDGLASIQRRLPSWLPSRQVPPSARRATPRLPYRAWRAPSGHEIRVGKRAADNDALTLHHSRGNDAWLHVKGSPGAHVVIRSPGESPPLDLLLLGAQVALVHSKVADGERREVSWTRCKHVRKPKGFPPGRVAVDQEKVLYVETSRAALEALTDLGDGA